MDNDNNDFTRPVSKLVELNIQHFDTLILAQKKAAEDYQALVQQRLNSAAEINDSVALASFVSDQMTLAQSSYDAMVANSRSLFEAMTGYNAEVIQLFQESNLQLKAELDKNRPLISGTAPPLS